MIAKVLFRALGLSLLARLGARVSHPAAQRMIIGALIAADLIPLVAVAMGTAGAGDVFALYWLENLVIGAATYARVRTARGADDGAAARVVRTARPIEANPRALARFFAGHFGGFVAVHGIFTLLVVVWAGGLSAGPGYWAVSLFAAAASQLFALGVDWFGQGQRDVVAAADAMMAPYGRLIVLHVALLVAFAVLHLTGGEGAAIGVGVLCLVKLGLDLVSRRWGPLRIELS